MRYGLKWPTYAKQWDKMIIEPARLAEFKRDAQYAVENKAAYVEIADASGLLWPHIAVIHRRESDGNFRTYLGNGDPLSRKTVNVPRGRGPFLGPKGFFNGAIDALRLDGLSSVKDWRLEKILYFCEIFNGTGYDMRGLASPYNWGGTSIQMPGKYVSDGKWNGRAWDTQPGCAPLLYMIQKLDPTIVYAREQ